MLTITVRPAKSGRFDAFAEGRYILTSRVPLCDAARALAAQGVPAETEVGLAYEGSDSITLRSTIAEAATLTIEEGDQGVRLRQYMAPGREGSPESPIAPRR